VHTFADVGGGRGYTLATLLESNPHLHGTLVDLPAAVARPDERLRPGGSLADRSSVLAGDCLVEIPVEADVYQFKSILEWDDEKTVVAPPCHAASPDLIYSFISAASTLGIRHERCTAEVIHRLSRGTQPILNPDRRERTAAI